MHRLCRVKFGVARCIVCGCDYINKLQYTYAKTERVRATCLVGPSPVSAYPPTLETHNKRPLSIPPHTFQGLLISLSKRIHPPTLETHKKTSAVLHPPTRWFGG